jgi:hypothetical protein
MEALSMQKKHERKEKEKTNKKKLQQAIKNQTKAKRKIT